MGYIGPIPAQVPLTSSDIGDGIITADKLATDAVETAKVKDVNVTAGKLATTQDLSSKTITLPATVSGLGTGITASQLTSTLDISSKTITLPASVSGLGTGITNAQLAGSIDVTSKITGVVPSANLGSGTGSSANFLRGDSSWQEVAGGISWQTVVTASTLTAVAGNGYWIDTTSNACTITLPASASNGDEIMFVDYARNWGTNGIILDSNGLNYQGDDDESTVEYGTDGTALHIVYSGATNGWIPTLDKAVDDVPSKGNQEGIFGYGYNGSRVSMSNLVSNAGVVASDVTGVGTARHYPAATQYGGDKAIFGFGSTAAGRVSITNLVSNAGVVATDTTGVGTDRNGLAACSYGGNKGIFGFGTTGSYTGITNLVSTAGVVASDVAAVGTARGYLAACEFGGDKGIFGLGENGGYTGVTNLVSNVGVVASDTTGVGEGRNGPAACSYGEDKGIFGFGHNGSAYSAVTNLVSNVGVVASDTTRASTGPYGPAACEFGGDKGIFGYGTTGASMTTYVATTNLVSNAGVVGSDVAGVGTTRYALAACSFN